jgi:hypothetical protein
MDLHDEMLGIDPDQAERKVFMTGGPVTTRAPDASRQRAACSRGPRQAAGMRAGTREGVERVGVAPGARRIAARWLFRPAAMTRRLLHVTWLTGHLAPVLTVVSAGLGLAVLFSERLSHPVAAAMTGTASGLVWWLDFALRNRLAKLEAQRQAAFESTPPDLEFLDAKLMGERLVVAIKSKNLVPYKCRWVSVTTKNAVVGGVQLQDVDVFPESLFENVLVFDDHLHPDRIVENYLELRFRYYSAFCAKLGNPPALAQHELRTAWNIKGGDLVKVEPREAA